MGNQLAAPSKPGAEHSGELQNMVVKETMGACAAVRACTPPPPRLLTPVTVACPCGVW
jgi:hypothetical protein